LGREPLACQIIANHPNKDQSFGNDQNIGRASFGLNPNKPFKLELIGWRSCLEDIEYPFVVAYERTRESLDIELRR
jgi:hypothetical protein